MSQNDFDLPRPIGYFPQDNTMKDQTLADGEEPFGHMSEWWLSQDGKNIMGLFKPFGADGGPSSSQTFRNLVAIDAKEGGWFRAVDGGYVVLGKPAAMARGLGLVANQLEGFVPIDISLPADTIIGRDGTTRKKRYGEGRQPWDDMVDEGTAAPFAAATIKRYLRRDKERDHSIESARWYAARLKQMPDVVDTCFGRIDVKALRAMTWVSLTPQEQVILGVSLI